MSAGGATPSVTSSHADLQHLHGRIFTRSPWRRQATHQWICQVLVFNGPYVD
jgi:hypothetical protein